MERSLSYFSATTVESMFPLERKFRRKKAGKILLARYTEATVSSPGVYAMNA
jgi:hypothetical protein